MMPIARPVSRREPISIMTTVWLSTTMRSAPVGAGQSESRRKPPMKMMLAVSMPLVLPTTARAGNPRFWL